MMQRLRQLWQCIRELSGDDAYERYLAHYAEYHQGDDHPPPLSREAFFKEWQDGKWKGVKRCC
jgi:uncharacterized short protein YbdD (DUF466 family)